MTLNSIFAGAIGIGVIGAVGYGIYKGLKDDKPSKARLAMRARTATPIKASVPAPTLAPVVETPAPTLAPVVETPALTLAPVVETPALTLAPVVETPAPTPNEFVSYSVKEAVANNKARVSIKDLRAEAEDYFFEKYDGEIYEEDRQWFNAAVEKKVEEYVKEAEDAGLRVLR